MSTVKKGDLLQRVLGNGVQGFTMSHVYTAKVDSYGGPRFESTLVDNDVGDEVETWVGNFDNLGQLRIDLRRPAKDFTPAQTPEELVQTLTDNAFRDRRGQSASMAAHPAVDLKGDPVVMPDHYLRHAIEPILFIRENNLPFWMGNVIKYVVRAEHKNGLEDLKKARRYLDMEIARMEGSKEWNK